MQHSSSTDTLHVSYPNNYANRCANPAYSDYVNPRRSACVTKSAITEKYQTLADSKINRDQNMKNLKSYSMFQKFIQAHSKSSRCASIARESSKSDGEALEEFPAENSQQLAQEEVYEMALNTIENLQTRAILKHLLSEHQRAIHEKKCLLRYLDYLDGAIQFPLYAPILKATLREFHGPKSEVFAVGLNEDHQLGLGKNVKHLPFTSKFRKVDLRDKIIELCSGRIQIIQISCGSLHVAALDSLGNIYTWGADEVIGRLDGNEEIPTKITLSPNHECKFISIVCGEYITACLSEDGKVYTFGGFRNSKGQRIGYHKLAQLVSFPTGSKIHQISASESMLAAIDESGSLYTWGNCEFGEGARPPFLSLTPKRVFIPFPIKKSFAFGFSLFLQSFQDHIYACGKNGFGELGLDSLDSTYSPLCVPIDNVKNIVGGIHHALILKNDGTVYGCGKNVDGQLGLGNNVDHCSSFQQIRLPPSFVYPAVHIAAGISSHHSYIIDSNHNLFTAGQNEFGQCGHSDESIYHFSQVFLKERKCYHVQGGTNFSILLLGSPKT